MANILSRQVWRKNAPFRAGGRRPAVPTQSFHYFAAIRSASSSSNNNSTLHTVANWIQESVDKQQQHQQGPDIFVLCGAGVSVAAGIPDFRTPGTGLYDNLQTYNLPYPEAVFDLDYFCEHPQAFLSLARDIWPGLLSQHSPTLTHSFLALLEQKNVLLRCYTQNIDGLEFIAGVSAERMMECHGHFRTASCTSCGVPADIARVKQCILQDDPVPPMCEECHSGYIKPDIVFFGEMLPSRLYKLLWGGDLGQAKLLLIMGTSLQVAPVSMIPEDVPSSCRRVLLNRDLVGNLDIDDITGTRPPDEFTRDLFHAGDCDESVLEICRLLGWEEELLKQNKATQIVDVSQ